MKKNLVLVVMALLVIPINAVGQESRVQESIPKTLLASSETNVSFTPSLDLSPSELETRINEINPYVLYRKGSVAEYRFQLNGKDATSACGEYFKMVVTDEKVENGLLVSYSQYRYNPAVVKGNAFVNAQKLIEEAHQITYPTEIDLNGHFHLTNDILEAPMMWRVKQREGYALMMPSTFKIGQTICCSTIIDKHIGGLKRSKKYSDFRVEKIEKITTPAGTFDCVKLTGTKQTEVKKRKLMERFDMWIARGVGVVKLNVMNFPSQDGRIFTIYLNQLDLK